ncbi:DNA-binding protein [Brevibacillus parabrevis]|uniref:DNA-binding protein n=1 Tax=Brevibacillus parabrevis TaxID=54914 RepID=UPI0028D8A115|nr:DNA-binding protein [Brevibacillus parabrevis]
MTGTNAEERESDLPKKLAKPAKRALANAGCHQLKQLTAVSEADVRKLHGMGPKALEQLRRALADKGMSFSETRP